MTNEQLNKKLEVQRKITETQEPWTNKQTRDKIVDLLISHVEENGSCRVGWAAQEIIGKPQQNHVHDKIAGLITKTNKYAKERNAKFPQDWTISINPNYKEKTWSEKHPVAAIFRTAGIGALFSLLVGGLLWLLANQKQGQVDSQQDEHLNSLNDSIAMIQKRIDGIK